MGWVLIALQNAFYRLLHAPSPEEGIAQTIACGGDTDTNAAIAGALLGAAFGAEAFPHQWVDRLLTCRAMRATAGCRRPRPPTFWPVDCLILAERLAWLGAAGR
jgi:ADP-ribosylglycohydrolase